MSHSARWAGWPRNRVGMTLVFTQAGCPPEAQDVFGRGEESLGSCPLPPCPRLCSGPGEPALDRTPGLPSCTGCKENKLSGAG